MPCFIKEYQAIVKSNCQYFVDIIKRYDIIIKILVKKPI